MSQIARVGNPLYTYIQMVEGNQHPSLLDAQKAGRNNSRAPDFFFPSLVLLLEDAAAGGEKYQNEILTWFPVCLCETLP